MDPGHRGLRPPGQGHHQLAPAPGAFQDLDGARERLAIIGVGGQALFPQAERAIDLAARASQIRGLTQKSTTRAGRRFDGGLAFENIEPLAGVGLALKQGTELAQCHQYLVRLGRAARQDLSAELDGGFGAVLARFLDVGGFEPQSDLQLRILGGLGGGDQAAHVGRRRRGHLGEELQTGARRGLFGLKGNQLDQLLTRRRQIALALEHVRGLVDQGAGFLRTGEGQGHAEGGNHAIQAALLQVARAQQIERATTVRAGRAGVGEDALGQRARHGVVGEGG